MEGVQEHDIMTYPSCFYEVPTLTLEEILIHQNRSRISDKHSEHILSLKHVKDCKKVIFRDIGSF